MYRVLLVVATGLLVCSSAFAAETEEPSVMLGEVVVTATRLTEELSNVPANVTIVTAEQIAQSPAQNIPELLRRVSGVLVNDISGNGRTYTVDLRGFGETASLNTLLLVDGRRINQADLSGVDWTLIPKDRVERIEIVRGGRGSVLYGDNATGGVINIITKKGTPKLNGTANALAGSYQTFQGGGAMSGTVRDLSINVNGNYRSSDGYRDNSDTLAKDAGANMEYEVSEQLFLRFNGGYHKDDASMPGGLYKSALDSGVSRKSTTTPDDFADTKDWYLQGGLQYYLTGNSYLDVDLSQRKREAEFNYFSSFGNYTGDTEIDTKAVSPQLVLNESLFGYETRAILGFDYEKNDEDIRNESSFSTASYDMSKESYGYFAHADVAVSENLSASGGFRHDRAEFDFKWVDVGSSASKTIDEDLYTFGITYRLPGTSSVYASYAKSFRNPVIDEFFNFYFNTVNDRLKAQTSDDFEAGVRLRLESGLSLDLNLFRVVTEDEIFYNPLTGANENLDGDGIRQGVELSVSQNIHDVLFSGSYTFRHTDIDGGQYDGKDLPNVPRHQLTVGVQKTFLDRVQLGLDGVYVGKRRYISDFDNNLGHQDDYFNLAGKLAYLLERGSMYVAVNNLLDEEYEEYGVDYGAEYLYPSPEINFVAGVEVWF
jgi:iron complex outermembrane receptor protein